MAFVTGKNTVIEALRGRRRVFRIFIEKHDIKDPKIAEILAKARSSDIPVSFISKEDAQRLGLKIKQHVAAEVEEYRYADIQEIFRRAGSKEASMIVFLDGVEDPQNFGNIIRTAEFFGADGIVIRKKRSVQVTPVVERISQGAASGILISRVPNIARSVEMAKNEGFYVIGLEADGREVLAPLAISRKTAFVLGGENTGLSRLVREKCDAVMRIEGKGTLNSLNVASAFAVACYCFYLGVCNEKQDSHS